MSMLSDFQYNDINLKEVKFITNDEFENNKDNCFEETTSFETKIGRAEDDDYTALVELIITLGDRITPYFIKITMRGIFKWNDNLDKELVDVLLKTNAPALLLSYARPIIANLTVNGRFDAINLPYVDFTKNLEQE